MLIGKLPQGYDPNKNDIIVFSKDGVHLLKISYQEFLKGVHGDSEAGTKLKYFYEEVYTDVTYPRFPDTYFLECFNHGPDRNTWDTFPYDCVFYYKDSSNSKIYFTHERLGEMCIYRKDNTQYSFACCATFSYHNGDGEKICGLYVKSTYKDMATICLATAETSSVIEEYEPEEVDTGYRYDILDLPKKYYVNYVEFKTDTLTNYQGCKYYKDGTQRSSIDDAYPEGASRNDCLAYCEAHDDFSLTPISFADNMSSVGIAPGNYPWKVSNTGPGSDSRNLIFWGGRTWYASTQFGYDRKLSALTAWDNGDVVTRGDYIYYKQTSQTTGTWVSVKDKIAALENSLNITWTGNNALQPRAGYDSSIGDFLYGTKLGTLTVGSNNIKIWGFASGIKSYVWTEDNRIPRITDCNIETNAELVHFVAKAYNTGVTGGPPCDAMIIHTPWDNKSNALASQIAMANGSNPRMFIRSQASNGTWSNWYQIPRWNHSAINSSGNEQGPATNRLVYTYTNGHLRTGNVTFTEAEYLQGARSNIQQQIDAIAGGGGGGSGSGTTYSRTSLYSGGTWTGAGTTLTLSHDITDYDEIEFVVVDKNGYFRSSHYFNSTYFKTTFPYLADPAAGDNGQPNALICIYSTSYVRAIMGDTDNKIQVYQVNNCFVAEVYGIKYGSDHVILSGTTPPQDSAGSNGDVYFLKDSGQKYKYIKLSMSKNKGNNTYTQITEFQFVDSNNKAFIWTGTRSWTNQRHHTMTDGPEAMLDGIISATSKALWECNPTSADTIDVILDCFEPIDLSVYSKVQFITGGDSEARDPASWVISVSNDKINWIDINSETDYAMTSTRLAVGYEATVTLPQTAQTFVKQKYYKVSDHWVPMID